MGYQPQTGTGQDLHDEFERSGVKLSPEDAIRVTPFIVPGTSEPFSVLATRRDANGRIVERRITFENFTQTLAYEYDAGGRLHKVRAGEKLIEEYLYEQFGERYCGFTTRMPQRSFRYGPALRLEKAGNVKYSYDAQGRLILKQNGPQATRYSYHECGQLKQVKLPDGRRISYEIDSEGKRISKFINSVKVETYLWHDFTTLAAATDRFGKRREFAYDEDGDPIAMRCDEKVYYFTADQVGTIYIVANSEGNEVKRIIRDSFGNTIVDTNKQMEIPLGFAAGLYDKDTGLVHFGHREYDPSIGRFIQPDPMGLAGGDVDVYGYCWDDPVNFVDPLGLFGFGGGFGGGYGGFGDSFSSNPTNTSKSSKKSTNTGKDAPDGSSGKAIGHGGVFGAFGTGIIGLRAHSNLGYAGNLRKYNSTDRKNTPATKSSAEHAREMERKAAVKAQDELQAEKAKLAEAKERRDRSIAAAKEREDRMRQMVSIGAIGLKNNMASPLTDTVDPNRQAKSKAGMPGKAKTDVGGKPSATEELGGYKAYSGYAGPSFAEYVGKDFDLGGTRFTGKNTLGESISQKADRDSKAREAQEHRDKMRHTAIGKISGWSSPSPSPLTQTVANAQQNKESGFWDAIKAMGTGIYEALSKTAEVLQGDEHNAIQFGDYVSPEKKEFFNTMMDHTREYAVEGATKGINRYGIVGLGFAPVTGSAGMLRGTIKGIYDMKRNRNKSTTYGR